METIEEEERKVDIDKYITITLQLLSAHSDFLFHFIRADRLYPIRYMFETLSFHLLTLEEFEEFLQQQCRT